MTLPRLPIRSAPVFSSTSRFLGLFLGAALGAGLSLLIAYLRMPQTATHRLTSLTPRLGRTTSLYLRLRLRAEISVGAKTNRAVFVSVASHYPERRSSRASCTQRVALMFQSRLREEDVWPTLATPPRPHPTRRPPAPLPKRWSRGACIRLQGDESQAKYEENGAWGLNTSAGVSCYHDALLDADEFWGQAALALNDADIFAYGKVTLYSQLNGSTESSAGRLTDWRTERELRSAQFRPFRV